MRTITNLSEFEATEHIKNSASTITNPRNIFTVENCVIDFEFKLTNSKLYKIVEFKNCRFKKSVHFLNITIANKFDFIECSFDDLLHLENVVVKGKSRFWKSKFSRISINNLRFEGLADFFKTTFESKVIFYKTDFLGTTVFTASTFKENVLFTYTKITDVIIFARTKFIKGLDLSQAIITGKIKNSNSGFKKYSAIADLDDDDQYRESFETNGEITLNNKRETFRILKKAALDDSNQFKFLEYSKLENEVYARQLRKVWYKRLDNSLIFLLNKISNNHNTSWILGVIFTGGIGFVFFYLSLLSTVCIEPGWDRTIFDYYAGKYFLFLSPVHELELFAEEIPRTKTIIFDFAGRIFVGYGIYQTVQAFRKHRG